MELARDDALFEGSCECLVCFEESAPGVCVDLRSLPPIPVTQCDREDRPANEIRAILENACGRIQDAFEENAPAALCSLLVVNTGTGDERFFEKTPSAIDCTDESRDEPSPSSSVARFNSFVIVDSDQFTAEIQVTGTAVFSGGNCRTGACPIVLHHLALQSPEFDVVLANGDTEVVTDGFVYNLTGAEGSCIGVATGCLFSFPAGSLAIQITGTDGGGIRRKLEATNTKEGVGVSFFGSRMIAVSETFVDNGTTITFGLLGDVSNFPPRITLPGPQSVECGFGVEISADVEDVDGDDDVVEVSWFVNGAFAARGTKTLTHDFAPGTHNIVARAIDPDGGFADAATTLEVGADTSPPRFISEPPTICLWPPNHERYVFTGEDLGVLVADDCDPNPRIVFTQGHSSQPDNDIGDGNTTDDIVVKEDSVCVRSERERERAF